MEPYLIGIFSNIISFLVGNLIQYVYSTREWIYFPLKKVYLYITNKEVNFTLEYRKRGHTKEITLKKIKDKLIKNKGLNIKRISNEHLFGDYKRINFELEIDKEEDIPEEIKTKPHYFRIVFNNINLSYRNLASTTNNILDFIELIEEILTKKGKKSFSIIINPKEHKGIFSLYLRRIQKRKISDFHLELEEDNANITITKDKIFINTNKISNIVKLIKKYVIF